MLSPRSAMQRSVALHAPLLPGSSHSESLTDDALLFAGLRLRARSPDRAPIGTHNAPHVLSYLPLIRFVLSCSRIACLDLLHRSPPLGPRSYWPVCLQYWQRRHPHSANLSHTYSKMNIILYAHIQLQSDCIAQSRAQMLSRGAASDSYCLDEDFEYVKRPRCAISAYLPS
jgi:hypothetical protein